MNEYKENYDIMKSDIEGVINYTKTDLNDFVFDYDLYEELDGNGSISEIIDGMIDIYYYDIRKWAVDNWEHVESAIEEGLTEGVTDYHKIIQSGQYMYYSEMAREVIEDIFKEYEEKQPVE